MRPIMNDHLRLCRPSQLLMLHLPGSGRLRRAIIRSPRAITPGQACILSRRLHDKRDRRLAVLTPAPEDDLRDDRILN